MAQSDILRKLQALFVGETEAVAAAPIEDTLLIAVPASADAGTTLASQTPIPVPTDCSVVSARFTAVTSGANNASNYATITLNRYYAGGTLSAVAAAVATSTAATSISAHVGLALTVNTSLANLSAGDALAVTIPKAGTGLSTAAGTLAVTIRRR